MPSVQRFLLGGVIAVVLVALVFLLWVLLSPDPALALPGKWAPIPLVCTSSGCVTSWDLVRQSQLEYAFSAATNSEVPDTAAIATTLVRQHLVHNAQVRSPITRADGERYRQEILNLTDEATIKQTTGLTAEEYDEQVIVPFLEQENLRQARRAESPEDLFSQLAQERVVIVLHLRWGWDKEAIASK